ncbi:MAG: DUF1145 domain-containing protein [Pseudomonas sp.]|uniref:DUF1145 domain-containing protein n=1 Tax=Pseudomonas sp. TaxID=306 RepID=UPI003394835B
MKVFLGFGKGLVLLFWGAVVVNLIEPFARPFGEGLHLAGGLVLVAHVLELLLFNGRFKGRANPALDRLQVLLFGAFHLFPLLKPRAPEIDHA